MMRWVQRIRRIPKYPSVPPTARPSADPVLPRPDHRDHKRQRAQFAVGQFNIVGHSAGHRARNGPFDHGCHSARGHSDQKSKHSVILCLYVGTAFAKGRAVGKGNPLVSSPLAV